MGAPFEGLWGDTIPSSQSLLERYHDYHGYPSGQYTDDTQLTAATLESIVECEGVDLNDIAARIAQLWKHHDVIGPGGACTHAAEHFLATGDWQTMGAPVGQAGNGTAMRTVVVGLMYVDRPAQLIEDVSSISCLTHQDSRSIAGGIAVAEASRLLAIDADIRSDEFCESIVDAIDNVNSELAQLIRQLPRRLQDDDVAQFIASAGQPNPEFDRPIITPFVIPTVLAALFCVMEYRESWSQAVTSAIRLGGDVDTLGAIVGALAGVRHGLDDIPAHLVEGVQDSEHLHSLAARYGAYIKRGSAQGL